jgi:hypothetical protein
MAGRVNRRREIERHPDSPGGRTAAAIDQVKAALEAHPGWQPRAKVRIDGAAGKFEEVLPEDEAELAGPNVARIASKQRDKRRAPVVLRVEVSSEDAFFAVVSRKRDGADEHVRLFDRSGEKWGKVTVPGVGAAGRVIDRDWKANPAVVDIPQMPQDIYCLGDIHGDYHRMVNLLAKAKLIAGVPRSPEEVRWTGGKAVLIGIGDMINKSRGAIPVLRLLQSLQAQAEQSGGRVVAMMGNHEQGFMADWRAAKNRTFVAELRRAGLSPDDVAQGRDALGLGRFLRNLSIGARIGDWFFCHAGNTAGRTVEQIEAEARQGMEAQGFAAAVLSAPESIIQARLTSAPWWEVSGRKPKQVVRNSAAALGVHHIVQGHHPAAVRFPDGTVRKQKEVVSHFGPGDGGLFLIDSGNSKLFHVRTGPDGTRATTLDKKGNEAPVWAGH